MQCTYPTHIATYSCPLLTDSTGLLSPSPHEITYPADNVPQGPQPCTPTLSDNMQTLLVQVQALVDQNFTLRSNHGPTTSIHHHPTQQQLCVVDLVYTISQQVHALERAHSPAPRHSPQGGPADMPID